MSLSLAQAKSLWINDQVKVIKTGEVWTVTGVAPVDSSKKVKILVSNGLTESFFDETRLHLFDLVEQPGSSESLEALQQSLNDAAHASADQAIVELSASETAPIEEALHESVRGTTVDLTAPEAEKIIEAIQEEAGEPDLPDAQGESPSAEASTEDEPRLEDKVVKPRKTSKRPK